MMFMSLCRSTIRLVGHSVKNYSFSSKVWLSNCIHYSWFLCWRLNLFSSPKMSFFCLSGHVQGAKVEQVVSFCANTIINENLIVVLIGGSLGMGGWRRWNDHYSRQAENSRSTTKNKKRVFVILLQFNSLFVHVVQSVVSSKKTFW